MKRKHFPYFRILEALREPGCALCRLGGLAADRFLEALLYEYVNDAGMRKMLVAAHGFCPNHSNALVARHDALGTSILYKAILNHLQAELDEVVPAARGSMVSKLRDQLSGTMGAAAKLAAHELCPACAHMRGTQSFRKQSRRVMVFACRTCAWRSRSSPARHWLISWSGSGRSGKRWIQSWRRRSASMIFASGTSNLARSGTPGGVRWKRWPGCRGPFRRS
jgi:hypothetical protein